MNKNAKLELYIGPMFSGKSTSLLRKIRLAHIINKKILVINHSIDKRYGENKLISHNNESEECISVSDLSLLDEDMIKKYDLVIIDEGQFFKNLKLIVLKWVEEFNIDVTIGGLDGDYKRNPIGEILELIPYADNYVKLTALCKHCNDGTPALFTHRMINSNEQILVGNDNTYIPLCRYHYNKENKKD